MINPSGIHQLRAPRGDRWFMTNAGVDEAVSLTPEGPQRAETQQWSITPVPGAEHPNMYYVYHRNGEKGKPIALAQQHRHGTHHHSRDRHAHDECCLPQGPVIVSTRHVDEWEITPMIKDVPNEHKGNAFVFRAATDAPGREWCIGTDGSKLAIKSFSVDSSEERPYWLVEDSK